MPQPNQVQQFVADLINSAGLSNMPESFKTDYAAQIGSEVEKRIGLLVLREIKPNDVEELTTMVEANVGQEQVANYLKSHIVDYEAKITADLEKFRNDFLRSIAQTKNSIKTTAAAV